MLYQLSYMENRLHGRTRTCALAISEVTLIFTTDRNRGLLLSGDNFYFSDLFVVFRIANQSETGRLR